MKIQGWIQPPALSASALQLKIAHSTPSADVVGLLSPVKISEHSYTKLDLMQQLQTAAPLSRVYPSIFKDYSTQYFLIKKEISESGTADQQKSLDLLDEVYRELTEQAADQLSDVFDQFFDSANKLYTNYGMSTNTDLFDREAFRSHLIDLSNAAKNFDSDDANRIEDKLALVSSGDRLENMNYRDMVNLADAIYKIAALKPPLPGDDPNKFAQDLALWHQRGIEILASAGLSDNIRTAAEKALQATAEARLKTGSFTQMVNKYKAAIEDTMKQLSQLMYMLATNDSKMKDQGIDPNDPVIRRLLQKEQTLRQRIEDTSTELKTHKEKLRKLEGNPDSATQSEEYRSIRKSYEDAMQGYQ